MMSFFSQDTMTTSSSSSVSNKHKYTNGYCYYYCCCCSSNNNDNSNTRNNYKCNDYYQRRRKQRRRLSCWYAGLLRGMGVVGMMCVAPALNLYALQYASPSILSPIGGGLTLIWIVILSERTIQETPKAYQIRAICQYIIVGQVLVAYAGDHTNHYALLLHEIQDQYSQPRFHRYLFGMALWLLVLILFLIPRDTTSSNSSESNDDDKNDDNSNRRFLIHRRRKQEQQQEQRKRFAWGVLGGSITGMQCFIKDALGLIHGLDLAPTWTTLVSFVSLSLPWELYGLLLLGGLLPLLGLVLLMQCMKRYDATYTASMFMGSIVISSSIMSAVHYHTFDHIIMQNDGMATATIITATNNNDDDTSNSDLSSSPSSLLLSFLSSIIPFRAVLYLVGLFCIVTGTKILATEGDESGTSSGQQQQQHPPSSSDTEEGEVAGNDGTNHNENASSIIHRTKNKKKNSKSNKNEHKKMDKNNNKKNTKNNNENKTNNKENYPSKRP